MEESHPWALYFHSFSPFLLLLPPPPVSSCLSLKLTTSSFKIIIVRARMHTHAHPPHFPGENSLSFSQVPLIVCISSSRCGTLQGFPVHIGKLISGVIMNILFRQQYCCNSVGEAFLPCLEDTIKKQVSWSSGSSNISSLPVIFPEAQIYGLHCRCTYWCWTSHNHLTSAF